MSAYEIKRQKLTGSRRLALILTEDGTEVARTEVRPPVWDITIHEGDNPTDIRVYERSWATFDSGFPMKSAERAEAVARLLLTTVRVQRLLEQMVREQIADTDALNLSLIGYGYTASRVKLQWKD